MDKEFISIVDFDGRYNQVLARTIRNKNVYCEVFPCDGDFLKLQKSKPNGIIVIAAPSHDIKLFSLGIPVLSTSNDPFSICDEDKRLTDFIFSDTKCAMTANWTMKNFSNSMIEELKQKLGDKKALCALSGGVDSTVCAVMVQKAIGRNLTCIFVDHGLMRQNEGDEVMEMFKSFDLNVIRVDAETRFLDKLSGIIEPEKKRKIIGEEFIRVFEEEAKKIGAVDYLVQGTIYPDIVESGTSKHAVVKSHHNVGGLPDVIDFKEILEPLKDLFKDEVRVCGLSLGIPEDMVFRQPFPGPGLGVRVIGELTKPRLDLLRKADFIYRDEISKAGLSKTIWQYFVVLTGVNSVGVRDGARVYGETVALRAVNSIDAMTADFAHLPYPILEKISSRIVNEIPQINRVAYDITSKPPATIEWE